MPDAHDTALAMEELLRRLFASTEAGAMATLAEHDLTLTQARLLVLLGSGEEPASIGTLAEQVGLTVASAGRAVDRLLESGLVDRTEHPEDRRVKLVALTPAGGQVVAEHLACKRRALTAFTARLDPTSLARLDGTVRALLDHPALTPAPVDQPVRQETP